MSYARYWIKLYHEINHDPKMFRLTPVEFTHCIRLFVLAGELGMGGELPESVDDMAFHLRADSAELTASIETLLREEILVKNGAGRLVVRKFADRQDRVGATERKRRQRERDRREEYYRDLYGERDEDLELIDDPSRDNGHGDDVTTRDVECHGDVTTRDVECLDSDSDSDSETMSADADAAPVSFSEWHDRIETESNKPAVVRELFETLFPGRDPPDFGYIGRVARRVSGYGRLAELLWQTSTRPPTGDVLAYVSGAHKRERDRAGPAFDRTLEVDVRVVLDAMATHGRKWTPQFDDPFLDALAGRLDWYRLGEVTAPKAESMIRNAWFETRRDAVNGK